MLNNLIITLLLLGLVVSCTNTPYDNNRIVVPPVYEQPAYKQPVYSNPYDKHPSERLAPVAPPKRYGQPTYSRPSNSYRPIKRLAPSSPPVRNNQYRQPQKNISRPNSRYLKQPSSNRPTKRLTPTSPPMRNAPDKQPYNNYRPRAPRSINGYRNNGYSSQYSLAENGNKTASGQIYDMYNMTAAHADLPLMSTVRVKNIRTGRSVIVTINDRLYHRQSLIKLSYVAANKLGLLRNPSQLLEVRGL